MHRQRTEAEVYAHLNEQLRLAEEAAYIIGHYHKAQDTSDFDVGQGFLAVGEMLRMTQLNIQNIATKALRVKAGLS